MVQNMIYPLNTVVSGPGIYEVIFEMSTLAQLTSFWGGMSPQDCFPRPRMLLQAVVSGTGYISSHPVVASTIVSMLTDTPKMQLLIKTAFRIHKHDK